MRSTKKSRSQASHSETEENFGKRTKAIPGIASRQAYSHKRARKSCQRAPAAMCCAKTLDQGATLHVQNSENRTA